MKKIRLLSKAEVRSIDCNVDYEEYRKRVIELNSNCSYPDSEYLSDYLDMKLNGVDVVRDKKGREVEDKKKRYSKKDISKVEIFNLLCWEMGGEIKSC